MTGSNNEKQARIAKAALTAFFNIASKWELSPEEQRTLLGNTEQSTFQMWQTDKSAASLPQDTLERVSYILGIYESLHVLLPSSGSADSWVKKPNNAKLFAGSTALDRMMRGDIEDLAVVRRYLDAQRA